MAKNVATQSTRERMGTPTFIGALFFFGVAIIGGAVLLGKSDGGEIDVTTTIQNSNQAAIAEGGDPADQIGTASQAFRNMPNGGLVPSTGGTGTPEPQGQQLPDSISEPATTTDSESDPADSSTETANESEETPEVQ